jgi:hypothetical protein
MSPAARSKAPQATDRPARRSAILGAINAPLGFYVLALLIAETTIGLVLIKSDLDSAGKFRGLLLAVGMFVLVVIIVTLLTWYKPENLTFDRDAHLMWRIPYGSEVEKFAADKLEPRPLKSRDEVNDV